MAKVAKEQGEIIEGFHAVAETRKIRDRLAEELKDMTPEEQVAYLREKAERFRHGLLERKEKPGP